MPHIAVAPPAAAEYDPFYARYVARVPEVRDAVRTLTEQRHRIADLFAAVAAERMDFRYAEGKWSVKELLGHMADAERVFAYRLLRIGRGDATPLAGFDEEPWVRAARFERRSPAEVLADWTAVREATITLVAGLPTEAWDQRGTANGAGISARALLYIIVGHAEHHVSVLREKYGIPVRDS